jgi:ParB-like chromosome segregation protein Spo0J
MKRRKQEMSTHTKELTLPDFVLVDIDSIEIGDRFRTDPKKDLDKLAESIDSLGLLNPVVITSDHKLIAGHRRILACQQLEFSEIEAHVLQDVDDLTKLKGEHDENVCRVEMTTGEARKLSNAMKPALEELAKANSEANLELGRQSTGSGSEDQSKKPAPKKPVGRVEIAAAAGTGKSRSTIKRANEIEKIANDPEQPAEVRETAAEVLTKVDNDETGVVPALAKVKAKQDEVAKQRGQIKAINAACKTLHLHADALEAAFAVIDGKTVSPVDNFDVDATPERVKEGWIQIRLAIARINKVSAVIGKIGA